MNDRDLLQGFKQCRQEIERLRNENRLLSAENKAYNRVFNALEAHQPADRNLSCGGGEDLIWKIRQTEDFLEKEIRAQEEKTKTTPLHEVQS